MFKARIMVREKELQGGDKMEGTRREKVAEVILVAIGIIMLIAIMVAAVAIIYTGIVSG